MIKNLAFGLGVLGLLAGLAITIRPTTTYARTQDRPLCTMPDSGTYSPGAMAKYGNDVYRCLYVFGDKLTPAGVAWVKMVQAPTTFVPKEPANGR